jgi:hypothetical protein
MGMVEWSLGDQVFFYDRAATVAAYASFGTLFAEKCGCEGCRNFAAQRGTVYPPNFRALLDQLGIDPLKEGEAVHYGEASPGLHAYDGWFDFVGSLVEAGESVVQENGFSYFIRKGTPPPPPSFSDHYVLALEFSTQLRWVLSAG